MLGVDRRISQQLYFGKRCCGNKGRRQDGQQPDFSARRLCRPQGEHLRYAFRVEVLTFFQPLSTAGPGGLGPKKHQGLQSHEVDPALAQNPDKDNSQGHGRDVNPTD